MEDKLVKQWWLIAVCLIVQTILTTYLVFGQPVPKIDSKLLNVTNSLLDLDTRLARTEQDNAILFRMLRNGNDQFGVIPDREGKRTFIPIPSSGNRIGDTLGDMPGDEPNR